MLTTLMLLDYMLVKAEIPKKQDLLSGVRVFR